MYEVVNFERLLAGLRIQEPVDVLCQEHRFVLRLVHNQLMVWVPHVGVHVLAVRWLILFIRLSPEHLDLFIKRVQVLCHRPAFLVVCRIHTVN